MRAMSSNAHPDADQDGVAADAGSSTDQQVTGLEETGTFTTDEPTTAATPVHGSSNAGINRTGANRAEPADRIAERDRG
jgi:hypothetical protein